MSNNTKNTGKIKLTLIKSPFGRKKDQIQTIKGLGLRKLNSTRELEDTPSVRGMVNKVKHLVKADSI